MQHYTSSTQPPRPAKTQAHPHLPGRRLGNAAACSAHEVVGPSVGCWGVPALAAGIGIAIWLAPKTIELPAADSPPTVVALPTASALHEAAASPGNVGAARPGRTAAGVSAERWAALRAEFADRPAELRRSADHFTFADKLDRFRSGRAGGSSAGQGPGPARWQNDPMHCAPAHRSPR